MPQYALILVGLDKELKDITNNQYTSQGFIKANNYIANNDISSGLHGILWGIPYNSTYLRNMKNDIYAIIKVEDINRLIYVDKSNNIVKFESGLVVFTSSSKQDIANYIAKYMQDNQISGINPCQIYGYSNIASEKDHYIIISGLEGKAISKLPSVHSIVTGEGSQAITYEEESHALGIGPRTKACTISDRSHSVVMSPGGVAKTTGNDSKAIAMERDSKAISIGSGSISICLGTGGQASAGEGGIIALAYLDKEGKMRIKIERIGEKVLANRVYRCNIEGELELVE